MGVAEGSVGAGDTGDSGVSIVMQPGPSSNVSDSMRANTANNILERSFLMDIYFYYITRIVYFSLK
jgi:hypothetical protein